MAEGFPARLEVLKYNAGAAGHARSPGPGLVTSNLREFARVPGLRVENWT